MSLSHLSDFPDRLPPMLVKELRQGLRARTFVAVFLTLHIGLCLILLSSSAASTRGDSVGDVISSTIFIFFGIAVLVVQPLRGIAAVSSEIKSSTIDMMVLTRLSATRIIYGKWAAIVSQSALLFVTIIPYLILRYFFGGMNVFGELLMLTLTFLTSMALTAITVGISGLSSVILRNIIPMIGAITAAYIILIFTFSGNGFRTLARTIAIDASGAIAGIGSYIAAALYLGWSGLMLGVGLIAPPAENHTTLHRVIVLLLSLAALSIAGLRDLDGQSQIVIFAILAMPAIVIALTETPFPLALTREKFRKYGIAGRFPSLFLSPGWPAGLVFTLLLVLVFAAAFIIGSEIPGYLNNHIHGQLMALTGTLLFPAVIINLTKAGRTNRVATYLLILLGSIVFSAVIWGVAASGASSHSILWLFAWCPFIFFDTDSSHHFSDTAVLYTLTAVNLTYFILLGIKALTLVKSPPPPAAD